jgi:hypothetical protein
MPFLGAKPCAFLFDADLPEFAGNYGDPIKRAFFEAMLEADPKGLASFRLKLGDLLIYSLSQRVAEVGVAPRKRGVSHYQKLVVDTERASAVIFELLDGATESWFSFDEETEVLQLATGNTYVLFVSRLAEWLRDRIDQRLRASPSYLGGFEVDLSNPLNRELFSRLLLYRHYYANRSLAFTSDLGTIADDRFELNAPGGWWCGLPFVEVFWHDEKLPPREEPEDFPDASGSPAGHRAAALLNRLQAPSHVERVARALFEGNLLQTASSGELVTFSTNVLEFQQAEIPPRKLTEYFLNEEHPRGRHKARLFRELLGITARDWRYLAAQIMDGIEQGQIDKVRVTEHGVQYRVDMPVWGVNGAVRQIRTGWLSLSGKPPRLVTALIPDDALVGDLPLPPASPLPRRGEPGTELWRAVYEEAHASGVAAASRTVPKAIIIDGRRVEREGQVGFAWIIIPDGRRAFGRWLRAEKLGHLERGKGTVVFAHNDSQSVERAAAYAHAFSRVLWRHGIESTVAVELD